MPPSPNRLVEDITEIMHKERSIEEKSTDSFNDDSKMSEQDIKKEKDNENDAKENEEPAQKKIKNFDNSWESSDISFLAETPV